MPITLNCVDRVIGLFDILFCCVIYISKKTKHDL